MPSGSFGTVRWPPSDSTLRSREAWEVFDRLVMAHVTVVAVAVVAAAAVVVVEDRSVQQPLHHVPA